LDSRQLPGIRHFYLESNLATDKKASQVNIMHTRGKRVVAEAPSSATC
jgi:hydroxymethylglutaryl-CoA reductase (NADPH)